MKDKAKDTELCRTLDDHAVVKLLGKGRRMVFRVWEFRRSRRIRLYIRRLGFLEFMRSVFVAILATNPTHSSSLLPSIRNSRVLQGAIRSSVSPNPASEFPLAIIPVYIPPRPFLFSCLYRLPGAVN